METVEGDYTLVASGRYSSNAPDPVMPWQSSVAIYKLGAAEPVHSLDTEGWFHSREAAEFVGLSAGLRFVMRLRDVL